MAEEKNEEITIRFKCNENNVNMINVDTKEVMWCIDDLSDTNLVEKKLRDLLQLLVPGARQAPRITFPALGTLEVENYISGEERLVCPQCSRLLNKDEESHQDYDWKDGEKYNRPHSHGRCNHCGCYFCEIEGIIEAGKKTNKVDGNI